MGEKSERRSERLHQAVARELGTQILTGTVLPGDAIDGEIEKSAAMGVSRTAYREAIRILAAKGLLESRPKAGTHVTARSKWNLLDPDVLAWMFVHEPNAQFVRDLFELRSIIEPAAAEWAAMRRTSDHLAAMARCLETMRTCGLANDDGQNADRQFHRLILDATHNAVLVSLSSSIGAAVQWTTRFKQRVMPQPRDPLPEHVAVYQAVVDGRPAQAKSAMQQLLRLALADMRPRNQD